MNDIVVIRNDIVVTDSRTVATFFDKEHKNVIQSIEGLIADLKTVNIEEAASDQPQLKNQPGLSNQAPSAFFIRDRQPDAQGQLRKMYWLTEDGFNLLAMGFTGRKALKFKLAFLAEFNRLRDSLKNIQADKFHALCHQTYQDALPFYHQFTNAVKALIEYAVTHGASRSDIDPRYYKFVNARVNRALGLDNGLRPFANPTTSVHSSNINKLIRRTIRRGIDSREHFAIIFNDVLDAIDKYSDDNIDHDERKRNNDFAHAHKNDTRADRKALEPAQQALLNYLRGDPSYDFEEEDA